MRTDIDKPNIFYAVEPTLEPAHTLLRLVNVKPKPLIVFDQSRDEVRLLCELIHRRTEQEVRFYHAGLSRPEKEATEKWFMGSEDGILVSTCAYGIPYVVYMSSLIIMHKCGTFDILYPC